MARFNFFLVKGNKIHVLVQDEDELIRTLFIFSFTFFELNKRRKSITLKKGLNILFEMFVHF